VRALLDTHIFLWWLNGDSRLSERCSEIISDGDNEVLFSVVSAWEIAVKVRLGRLVLPKALEPYISEQVWMNRFEILPIDLIHALRTSLLPDHHKDPFDRMLIAQAQVEDLTILTADTEIARYPVRTEA
jgi:PIN domain nuclease of toxin-antitoxin system